jgi:putative Ca2+/H+ antiporter (TMEM165/GDT1 family)
LRAGTGEDGRVDLAIVAAVFPVIFLGELPDKTMFASLVMASRGHPVAVWIGAAGAFLVHVVIAVTIGVSLFHILPARLVDALVAVMFLAGAIWAFSSKEEPDESGLIAKEERTHHGVAATAFAVIFVAEWGDLTQILTANLAARYGSGLSVAVGAALALWTVAAVAVISGQGLLRRLSVTVVRRVTGVILVLLALVSAIEAVRA